MQSILFSIGNLPFPDPLSRTEYAPERRFAADDRCQLAIGSAIRSRQRRNIDRISDRLVARRIYHIPKSLLGILDASTFRVTVAEENQFLQLTSPKAPDTLAIDLRKNCIELKFMRAETARTIQRASDSLVDYGAL